MGGQGVGRRVRREFCLSLDNGPVRVRIVDEGKFHIVVIN